MALLIAGAIFLLTCLGCVFISFANTQAIAPDEYGPALVWPWFVAGTVLSVLVASFHWAFAAAAELPIPSGKRLLAAYHHRNAPPAEIIISPAARKAHTEAILEFNPQYDITAYELAQAMQFFIASMRHPPDDMEKAVASLPFNVRRHLLVK